MSKSFDDRTIKINGDAKHSAVVSGDNNVININSPSSTTEFSHRHPSQEKLLRALDTEIHQRLRQSLPDTIRIESRIERQDYLVQKPWSITETRDFSHQEASLVSATQILEVFDLPELSHQLLILGEPGSGKTVMLLELAQGLWQRAKSNKTAPVPVLIDLSSWNDISQSIFDWLLEELQEKYQVSKGLVREWIEANHLLPLLDGFDEVAPQHQAACAYALNDWLLGPIEQQPVGVVICSRQEEYRQLEKPPLNLYGALQVMPWTEEQVRAYLLELGLEEVWQEVIQDEALKNVLTKPLFLSMFGLAQRQEKFSLHDWQSNATTELRIEYLLDIYWEAALTRQLIIDPQEKRLGKLSKTYGRKPLPNASYIQRALVFAAKGLEKESRTELLIERIQPSWLQTPGEKSLYDLLVLLLLSVPLMILLQSAQSSSPELALLLTTFPWLRFWLTRNEIVPAKRLRLLKLADLIASHRQMVSFILTMVSLSIYGLSWFIDAIGTEWRLVLVVPLTGLMINLTIMWLIENIREEVVLPIEANQGMKNLWRNMPLFVLFLLPIVALVSVRLNLSIDALVNDSFSMWVVLSYGAYILIFAAFEGGGKALLQHVALRFVCAIKRYASLRQDLLLDYCTERLILQRLGGRYRFMHRFLQEYFAKMDLL
ncbi:MAG: NACHT domain-containing NTPase [Phormidesmis sp.]